jgi:hypothetical protein
MTALTSKGTRHRWEATDGHLCSGPKYWRCVKCGLSKITEWEEKPRYHTGDGREWIRFAPPCPPGSTPSLAREADAQAEARRRRLTNQPTEIRRQAMSSISQNPELDLELQIEVIEDRVNRDGRYTRWRFASIADRALFLKGYKPSPTSTWEMIGDREMIMRTRPVYSESITAMGEHRRDG